MSTELSTNLASVTEWLPLLGVLIAQAVVLGLFWFKQRADDKTRWQERRLALYADWMDLLHRQSVESARRRHEADPFTDEEQDEAIRARNMLLSQIALVGSVSIYQRALEWAVALRFREQMIGQEQDSAASPLVPLGEARKDFIEAVRTELKVDPQRGFHEAVGGGLRIHGSSLGDSG